MPAPCLAASFAPAERLRAGMRWWGGRRRAVPAALFIGALVVCLAWNGSAGLSWGAPSDTAILLCVAALGSLSVYARARRLPRLGEATLFILIHILYPLLGIRLSYLAVAAGRPFIDPVIARCDRFIGFDWADLAAWEIHHPVLLPVQAVVYQSHFLLALASVVVFAYGRPGQRNDEMFFILFASLLIVIAIFAAFPTLGPASLAGTTLHHQTIIAAIRAGHVKNLEYDGIISFPSYHTIMAVAFVYCHRGIRTFVPVAAWNGAMLLTVPYGGDHQLTDMAAGAAIAGGVIGVARLIYRPGA